MRVLNSGRNPSKCVLLIGNFLSESVGTRSVVEDLALRLEVANWRVIRTSSRPSRVARLIDMTTTVWRARRNYKVAHVDVFSGPAFVWAEVASWLLCHLNKPYILTLHGGNLPQFAERFPHRVSKLLHSASVVTTPSRYLKEQMHVYRRDMALLPNPIDLSSYDFRLRDQPRPKLVWLRAFHSIYNPTLAVEVVSLLSSDFPDMQLIMVGPDKGDGSLQAAQEAAVQLRIDDRVSFPGGVPKREVSHWLQQGDIFLNTTTAESFGVSVMEAAACGLPIVTTNVGELPYLWQDEEDALLVPVGDAHAMANAVRRLLTDRQLAERLSQNARRKAEQFDWSVILPQWEELLMDTVGGGLVHG